MSVMSLISHHLLHLGLRIHQQRRVKRWTLRDLAQASGVSVRTLSRIESGDGSVAIASYLAAIATLDLPLPVVVERRTTGH